jgi:oligopeptide/dipeptide ABC transporter ATP-binding protein
VGRQLADGLRAAGDQVTTARISELLAMVAMPANAAERYPHEFSGGQRQRLAIGRALAARPSMLVADEPVSSLDASAQAAIVSLLDQLRAETGLGILLISHDLAVVRQVAQRIAVMYLGQIVETGPVGSIWRDPRHPYAESLLAAVPMADGTGYLPAGLAGEVPDPSAPPPGCSFHPRCPIAKTECRTADPPSLEVGGGHSARCLFALRQHNGDNQRKDDEQAAPLAFRSRYEFVEEANQLAPSPGRTTGVGTREKMTTSLYDGDGYSASEPVLAHRAAGRGPWPPRDRKPGFQPGAPPAMRVFERVQLPVGAEWSQVRCGGDGGGDVASVQ